MILLLLAAVFLFLKRGNALPIAFQIIVIRDEDSTSNDTVNADPAWVAAPRERGTWQLIIGCLMTLSLCAWTAYHPNVHPENRTTNTLWRRFRWMMAAVVGPEAILYYAWEQRWTACQLRNRINRFGERAIDGFDRPVEEDQKSLSRRRLSAPASTIHQFVLQHDSLTTISTSDTLVPRTSISSASANQSLFPTLKSSFTPWTLQQAFFAVSGGLTVDTSSFWHVPQMTLTPRGLMQLTRAGLLPHVTNEEVTEKSKANTAAKIMVCIQASWFLLQAVARLAQKLPLTLLEIHVLTHVLCALGMYFCWVDKPYDVGMPVVVDDELVKDMVALFLLDATPWFGTHKEEDRRGDRLRSPIPMNEIRDRHVSFQRKKISLWTKLFQWDQDLEWIERHELQKEREREEEEELQEHVESDAKSPFMRFSFEEAEKEKQNLSESSSQSQTTPSSPLTPPDQMARIQDHQKRANRALDHLRARHFAAVACRGDKPLPSLPKLYFRADHPREQYVVVERSNRRIEGKIGNQDSDSRVLRSVTAFGAISVAYGGVHLCAWNDHFPSAVECWMWRVAALCMVAFPVIAGVLGVGMKTYEKVKPQRKKWRGASWLFWLTRIAVLVVAFAVLGPLVLSEIVALAGWSYGRGFMLVEAFVSLRSPPVGTYKVLEWSAYWPHAG
ncbi:uncharacterized protein BKA78DRAFT_319062 [Phyllosticta capitalensis]|uniref:uncharacterized protein n=1 Tax=Phyllosticta capitalensis TaxID=121624 RepID=UPI003131A543